MVNNRSKLTKSNAYLKVTEGNSADSLIEMFNIHVKNTVEPILVDAKINGTIVNMELDSGTGVSILPVKV